MFNRPIDWGVEGFDQTPLLGGLRVFDQTTLWGGGGGVRVFHQTPLGGGGGGSLRVLHAGLSMHSTSVCIHTLSQRFLCAPPVCQCNHCEDYQIHAYLSKHN